MISPDWWATKNGVCGAMCSPSDLVLGELIAWRDGRMVKDYEGIDHHRSRGSSL